MTAFTFEFKPKTHHRLELHMLKCHSATNMNRDDLGRPKELYFGGYRRQRISSQCLKNRIRKGEVLESFRQDLSNKYRIYPLIRTAYIAELITKRLLAENVPQDTGLIIAEAIANKMAKFDAKSAKTQLVSTSEGELINIIKHLKELNGDIPENKEKAKEWVNQALKQLGNELEARVLRGDFCPEIQLFGRMMTNQDNFAPVDSTLQVMHAFTTHEVPVQKDYWTGEDDIRMNFDEMLVKPTDKKVIDKLTYRHSGASMIETRRFNSGVYYHYHCIDLDLLFQNMSNAYPDETTKETIAEICAQLVGYYLLSCIGEQPTGNQTGLASPDIAEFTAMGIGNGFPISAASAYEKPVGHNQHTDEEALGYLQESIESFKAWYEQRKASNQSLMTDLEFSGASFQPHLDVVTKMSEQCYAHFMSE